MHDDVFRLNLIQNGGWTKDTMHILVELVELALQQKAWNQRYGHISYADRMSYYARRADRFANRKRGSDEQQLRVCDRPTPNEEEIALKQDKDIEKRLLKEKQVEALGKGKGITKASAPAKGQPDPAQLFSVFWDRSDAARWGYPSVKEFLRDKRNKNLPFQRGASGGAAGSSQDYLGPYSADQIFTCLQCNEPSAIINLWKCDRCSVVYGEDVYFHCRSMNKNCYEEHTHYCESKALFGWTRAENKRGNVKMPAAAPTS